MPQTYCRDDPVSGRWSGVNRLLTEYEVDDNFYTVIQRVVTLENNSSTTVSISFITLTGNELTFTMTDHTTRGPFTVPQATFVGRGAWQANTSYAVNNTFDINGTLYLVIFQDPGQSTFDANANDGMGHNYFSPMITVPGSALPTGGAVGMMLYKTDGHDFDVSWKYPVPVGGSAGQVLTKVNSTDFNMGWTSITATLVGAVSSPPASPGGAAGQVLATVDGTSTNTEWVWQTSAGVNAPPPSPAGIAGQLLATVDGTTTNMMWVDAGGGGGGGGGYPDSTITALGDSGTVTMDGSLGDVFTTSPTTDILINGTNPTAGQIYTVLITTANASGFKVQFGSDFGNYRGDVYLPKESDATLTISFRGDGSQFWEMGRAADEQLTALGTTGTVSISTDYAEVQSISPTGDCTLNAISAGGPNRRLSLVVTTSGTSNHVLTFGTNFKSTGTLATGTVSGKVFTVNFVSDGTNLNETSRTTAM